MKKILLGTTAVVALATMSTEAFAADKIQLGLGGFTRHYVGLANNDEVAATANSATARGLKLSQFANSEVYFRGATTLDNGLSVSVDIQREADKRNAGAVDVSAVTVSSDAMGALTIGSTTSAGDDFAVRVPQASGLDWSDGYSNAWVATTAGAASTAFANNTTVDIETYGDKSGKLKYVSPSFSGVTAFASYSAHRGGNDAQQATRNAANDGSSFGLAYEGEVGGASISADVQQLRNNGSANINHFGLSVGMAGFTVGGGYMTQNDDQLAATAASSSNDGKSYEIGVGYETGPYTLTAGYMKSESKGVVATAGNNTMTNYAIGAAYDLGAGVALVADYYHAKTDAEGAAVAATDGTVSGVIAGIEIGF